MTIAPTTERDAARRDTPVAGARPVLREKDVGLLREILDIQRERAKIENEVSGELRVPGRQFTHEIMVVLRILKTLDEWTSRLRRERSRETDMGGDVAPRRAQDGRERVITAEQVDAVRQLRREVLRQRRHLLTLIEVECEQGYVHPRGWKKVEELAKMIVELLKAKEDLGLLGIDLRSIGNANPDLEAAIEFEIAS